MIWGGIAIHLASLISNLLFSSVLATGVVNLVATLHLAVLTVLVFPSALLVAFIILIVMYLTYWFPADEGQQSTIA